MHVDVNDEEIVTTPAHPFWVPQKGWISAADLRAGDRLQLVNGKIVTVEAVQHEILENPVKVYNFEIVDWHTYYVGRESVLVHDDCTIQKVTNDPLMDKADDIRNTEATNRTLRKEGNVATAEADIPGLYKTEYYAHSRIDSATDGQAAEKLAEISPLPQNSIFETFDAPNANGDIFPRAGDTEAKILEDIASRLATILTQPERSSCTLKDIRVRVVWA